MPTTEAAPQLMSCMEIWGGNTAIDTSIQMPGIDAWVYARPYQRSTHGGDVHYVSTCATGRITRLLLADVSGHGDQVKEVARVLRDLMRQFVNYLDQRRFVRMMNQRFTALSATHIFATALVTTFFSPTRVLSLCNAGHPPPLLFRARDGVWSALETAESAQDDPSNLPLGVVDFADYHQLNVRLEVGDMVLLYTDSLIESTDSTGELLGTAGLLKLVRSLGATDALNTGAFISRLLSQISATHPNNLLQDDVTALLMRANGSGSKVKLKDKALAPLRVGTGILASLFRGSKALPIPEISIKNIGGALFNRLSHH